MDYSLCPDYMEPEVPQYQKYWDNLNIVRVISNLPLELQSNKAKFLASRTPEALNIKLAEASAWLTAIPSRTIGTMLDNNTFRIAVDLRLGCKCVPHQCRCGDNVDRTGVHGLSCQMSAGRFGRHAALNDLIRALC
uniref:Uncharacterized protein n=1 Tax=Photinus pyralis TaxID=7054 RepID=A0A1Y1LE69_PHOPY